MNIDLKIHLNYNIIRHSYFLNKLIIFYILLIIINNNTIVFCIKRLYGRRLLPQFPTNFHYFSGLNYYMHLIMNLKYILIYF